MEKLKIDLIVCRSPEIWGAWIKITELNKIINVNEIQILIGGLSCGR